MDETYLQHELASVVCGEYVSIPEHAYCVVLIPLAEAGGPRGHRIEDVAERTLPAQLLERLPSRYA